MVTHLSSTISTAVLIYLSWSSVTAAAFLDLPLNRFFSRDSSVATCAANYNSCGSSYAGSFCCSSETTCLPLDSGSSVLCCPTGSNCTFIEPISCNIQALNATANPTAPIQSTRLTDNLPTCADGCCPFGYTCAKNITCVLDASTSNTGVSNSLSGSATGTAAAAATTATQTNVAATSTLSIGDTSPATSKISAGSLAATSTTTASTAFSSNSGQAEAATKCSQFTATAVVAGFFPGALTGALVAAMIMMCRRRVGDQRNHESISQKTRRSSAGEIVGISDPIPDDENGSFRTDFLLQRKLSGRYPTPGTVSRPKSMIRRTGTRVKSIFIGPNNNSSSKGIDSPQWNTATPPMPSMPPANLHATRTMPVTPPEQTDRLSAPRQQSTESIKVYSPPNMLGISSTNIDRNTTFSEVMEKAGFQNTQGQPRYRLTETPVHGQSPLRGQNPSLK